MTHETAARIAPAVPEQRDGEPEAAPAPPQPAAPAGPAGPAGPLPVPFDRLLAVATLTPGQASLVAARLLHACAAGAATEDAATPCCRLGPVSLTPSGDLEVADAPAEDGTPVTELLRLLLQNARRLPAHPRPEQHLLLHRLEEAAAEPVLDPVARADGLEAALAATLGSGARQRVSSQLAALVEAAARVVPPAAEGVAPRSPAGPATRRTPGLVPDTAEGSRPAPHRAVPAAGRPSRAVRRGAHLSSRTRRRRALVVAAVVAVLAAGAYVGLLGRGAGVVDSLGLGSHPNAPATHAPARPVHQPAQHSRAQDRGVPTLAARHAGPIAGLLVQKAGGCRPGSLCPVKVTVHLRTGSAGRPLRWRVGTARLCKRGIVWSAPTTVTPRPGWRTVYASSSVRIPQGRSLALLAVTTAPARVQSPPVPVTGSALHC